jgi:ribose-phosphate pyrophosphokinase
MRKMFLFSLVISFIVFNTTLCCEASETSCEISPEDIEYLTGDDEKPMQLFCGNASKKLGEAVAKHLGIEMGDATVSRFNDGEIRIRIHEDTRNKSVFVLQSTCGMKENSINDSLMELYLLIRTLKRSSARIVTAVIPYYGYARQDRKLEGRVPISASDVAMLLEVAGADRVIAIDLHCGQIQGFFHHSPVDNLYAGPSFVSHFVKKDLVNPIVVSPDAGGVERACRFRAKLAEEGVQAGLAVVVKRRAGAGVIEKVDLVGDVEGCDIIIVDDMCDTAGTLTKTAAKLKFKGARNVYACITHPVFSGPALERIENSVITEMVVADTIPLYDKELPENITQVTIAPLLAEAIKCIYKGQSLGVLF